MRGPLRWARICGGVCNAVAWSAPLRLAERPPHPHSLRSLDLSRWRGEVTNAFPFPRAPAPRVLPINNVPNRHCEERSDEAIQNVAAGLDCFASLAMTHGGVSPL